MTKATLAIFFLAVLLVIIENNVANKKYHNRHPSIRPSKSVPNGGRPTSLKPVKSETNGGRTPSIKPSKAGGNGERHSSIKPSKPVPIQSSRIDSNRGKSKSHRGKKSSGHGH
ncbi:uncharacterized protein LOC105845955 isoform X1 [Hydra vulgaris]|uniref:uncharacterized protein LOC105845955 isoform X1 n=1 Tax=Hydra vulgaris TaxID=6087 RepID=UPI000640FCCF|nr:uncharacterized protein LOC105845955 isoform X1 [Hydra vulgaris]